MSWQPSNLVGDGCAAHASSIVLSFVVIGCNEGKNLRACLESVRAAHLPGIAREIIYVDGGSQDDSVAIAHACGLDCVLGSERRRRAAENRNLGASYARGQYIQFLDGDMVLDSAWPGAALAFMDLHPEIAAVSGRLIEANTNYLFQVLQLDWNPAEGQVDSCGGGALFRRDAFNEAGGFPEDVAYGEEPYLCWRIRNLLGKQVFHLDRSMALHDLGFAGLGDYWRQCTRNGATYIEIASRCVRTSDPLWLRQCIANFAWTAVFLIGLAILFLAPNSVRLAIVLLFIAVYLRKLVQVRRRGHPWSIAAGYALHVYICKVPLCYGQLRWLVRRLLTGDTRA